MLAGAPISPVEAFPIAVAVKMQLLNEQAVPNHGVLTFSIQARGETRFDGGELVAVPTPTARRACATSRDPRRNLRDLPKHVYAEWVGPVPDRLISGDLSFSAASVVPRGYTATALALPSSESGELFLKLRDAPDVIVRVTSSS